VSHILSRRAFAAILAGAALDTRCGRKLGKRYNGWLFVASGRERAVAVADLNEFRPMTKIAVPVAPDQLFRAGERVYAVCQEGAALIEISLNDLRVAARINLGGKPVAARVLAGGKSALVALASPGALAVVDLDQRKVSARMALAGDPGDLDATDKMAALTVPSKNALVRVGLAEWKTAGTTETGAACRNVLFRKDGRTILAGAPASREVVTVDAETGALLARLPVAVVPARFCFNPDGGQMFVTGAGGDVVAIVSPYQNEVGETMLAGRTPAAMAVVTRQNLLCVTNAESGDLTILDIDTRHLSASVHVGETPGEVLVTPDGEYVLVVDRRTGSVSVVRLVTVLDKKVKTKPLFTVFPTATDARAALVVGRE
jgi:YVTN family beta-propeller protein